MGICWFAVHWLLDNQSPIKPSVCTIILKVYSCKNSSSGRNDISVNIVLWVLDVLALVFRFIIVSLVKEMHKDGK